MNNPDKVSLAQAEIQKNEIKKKKQVSTQVKNKQKLPHDPSGTGNGSATKQGGASSKNQNSEIKQ